MMASRGVGLGSSMASLGVSAARVMASPCVACSQHARHAVLRQLSTRTSMSQDRLVKIWGVRQSSPPSRISIQSRRWKSTEAREDVPRDPSMPSSAALAPIPSVEAPKAQRSTAVAKSKSKDAMPTPDVANIRELLRLAKPQWKLITAGVGFLVVSTGVNLSIPYTIGRIIDFFAPGSEATTLFGLPLEQATAALALILFIGAACNAGRSICLRLAGQRTIQRIRNMTYSKFLNLPPSHIESTGVGDALSRLGQDTSIIGQSLSENLGEGLKAVLGAVVGIGAMYFISPSLTFVMLFVVPPISIGSFFYGRYIRKLSAKTQEALGSMSKLAEERLSAHRTISASNTQPIERGYFAEKVNGVFKLQKKETFANGIYTGGNEVLGDLGMIGLLMYGGVLVTRGQISVGDMTSLLIYVNWIEWSLNALSGFFTGLMKGVGASQRVLGVLAMPSPIPLAVGEPLSKDRNGAIELRNIRFFYPSRPDVQVLKGLNLKVERGERVALVGGSGSGKSSIHSLLLRFYDPAEGEILFDGQNIKEFVPESWRARIGVVPQDPILFGGSIHYNIAYGAPESTTREDVIRAAKLAHCDFIEGMPEGYDTIVGKASLSGGQRQRIAIARALVGHPSVLLMDEATSALDSESETAVNAALDTLFSKSDITVILIAHRLSSIAQAGRVVLLDGGAVVEDGSYEDLISRPGGRFRKMVEGQLAKASIGAPEKESPRDEAEDEEDVSEEDEVKTGAATGSTSA